MTSSDSTVSPGSTSAPRLTAQQVLDVLRAAHQAPSIHNSQPWVLQALPDGIEVLEDARRALPASDPRGRDRIISCGAAARNAQVAVARLGWEPRTVLLPHGPDDPSLARVVAGAPVPVSGETEELYRAIWDRRTHRRIFMANAQGDDVPATVHRAVRGTRVRLAVVPTHQRARFAQLLWEAAQEQVADDERRAEIQKWTRVQEAEDGLPTRSLGNAPFPVDSLLVHTLRPKESAPSWMTDSLASGPVVVLLTDGDDRADWVRAGLALESVLLAATAAGLVASFLNQVVQQEGARAPLVELLGELGYPQIVLRIGTPLVDVPSTPRRPLMEVTRDWP
ncbi:MAG TPA: nitroreductase family protein, partial [Myxococcaceae bacterium]|nr:nitroreductase family protein [Myxococcaceae bacterium]